MKKLLFILVAMIAFSTISSAQKSRAKSSSSSSDNPRAERQVAITTEAGWKTTSGTGINLTYYALPKLAIDGGVGLGLQGLKFGTRARFLFLDQEFTPVLGVGFNMSPKTIQFGEPQLIEIDADFDETTPKEQVLIDLEINKSYYGHVFTGVEFMSQGGFVAALNVGYRISLNETIDTDIEVNGESFEIIDELTDSFINSATKVYGSGLSFSLHLGYAF